MNTQTDIKSLKTFAEFYPFYLGEHSNRTCRRLHFVGSSLSLGCLLLVFTTGNLYFGFEKNKPASFKRPLYSFMGDWVMYKDILIGKIPF
jgi:hypothetical protein